MAAPFADTATTLDRHVLLSALTAVVGSIAAGPSLASSLSRNQKIQRSFESPPAFMMIFDGLSTLLDNVTDRVDSNNYVCH